MDTATKTAGDVTIIEVSGNVDALTAEDLTKVIEDQIEIGNVKLVVDLQAVKYTSSAGLRAFLRAAKDARKKGGDFRLAASVPDVMKVLEISGFISILKHYSTTNDAVVSYTE